MNSTEPAPVVKHNEVAHRYEIWIGDEKVGHADYSLMLNEIHFVHTEVDPKHQGKSLAGILMKNALDDVRAKGNLQVVPVCSYVVRYMAGRPETQDLLARPIEEAVEACRLPNVAKVSEKLGLNKPE